MTAESECIMAEFQGQEAQMKNLGLQKAERVVCLGDVTNLWDKIGSDRGLKSDSDIASFLVRYYEDTSDGNQSAACCVNCLTPLTLSCSKCGATDQPGGGIKMPPPGSVPKQPKLGMPQRIRHVNDDDDIDVDLLACDPASPTAEQVARTMVQLAFTTEEPPTPVMSADNSDNKDLHACPHCNVKFAHMNGLSRHLSLEICYTKAQEPILTEIRPVRSRLSMPSDKIRCVECSLEFLEEEQLRDHMKVHTEARPYVCCHCGVGFLEKTVLTYHLKTHQGLHVCHRCGSEFVNKHGLTAHLKMQICTQDESEESEEAFIQGSDIASPVKKKKRQQFYVDKNTCKFCGKKLASPSHLKRHILSHTGERPYVCQACGASFTQKSRLIDHHNRTHALDKPIKCGTCNMKFFTTMEFNKHVCETDTYDELEYEAEGQTGDSRPFKCEYCNAEFAYSTHLTAHIQTHTGMKEFRCPHCDKAFGDNRYLKQHLRKHNRPKPVPGADVRPHKCHMCTRAFKTRKMLTNHIRVHTGEKPYHCQECGKAFAQRCNYRRHIRIHTGEKPFTCKQCGQSFAHKTTYIGHVRAHTGIKPYRCGHCDKTFRQSYSLTIHVRTHTHEKPYTCSECNSAFSHPSSLTIHMRKHTGEKPFRCPHCDQNFASASNCRAHIRKTHKDDTGTPIRDRGNIPTANTGNRKPRGRKPKQDSEKPIPVETSSCAQVQVQQNQPGIPEQPQAQQPQQQQQHIPQAFRPEAIPVYGLWDGLRPALQFPPPPPDAHSGPTLQMQAVWNDFRQPHDLSHPRTHPQWN